MMLGITIIAQWITIVCLIIRMRMIEKEVENIKSWEMFAKICARKWESDRK